MTGNKESEKTPRRRDELRTFSPINPRGRSQETRRNPPERVWSTRLVIKLVMKLVMKLHL